MLQILVYKIPQGLIVRKMMRNILMEYKCAIVSN